MIKLQNVSVCYDTQYVLKNISFEIKKNEIFSIIGVNGSGKTTLLRAICNTLKYDGKIFLNNQNIRKYKRKELAKEIGMFSQVNQTYFDYTVFEIVMMGRYIHSDIKFHISDNKNDIYITENALRTVGIYDLRNREISTLSGGQIQRVFLAKLIAQDPNILILDEPTNHLDLSYQIEIIDFLKNWAKEKNKTIIGVLHDINLAMYLSDNIIILDRANLKYKGKTTDSSFSKNINQIYNIDVKQYMLQILKKWEKN